LQRPAGQEKPPSGGFSVSDTREGAPEVAQATRAKKPPEGGSFHFVPGGEGVVHIMGWKAHETSVFSDLKFEVPPKVPPGRSALLLQLLKLIAQ
jgi:hypothetical protein